MPAGFEVTTPAKRKVTKIDAKLQRAQNSNVTFESDVDGSWLMDGQTGEIENQK